VLSSYGSRPTSDVCEERGDARALELAFQEVRDDVRDVASTPRYVTGILRVTVRGLKDEEDAEEEAEDAEEEEEEEEEEEDRRSGTIECRRVCRMVKKDAKARCCVTVSATGGLKCKSNSRGTPPRL
jgi:hypothetical protein